MLQRYLSLVLSSYFALAAALLSFAGPWGLGAAAAALLAAAALRPVRALLFAALAAPLGAVLAAVGAPAGSGEVVLAAALAGWLIGRAWRGDVLADPVFACVAVFTIVTAVASAVVVVGVAELSWQPPAGGVREWFLWVAGAVPTPHSAPRQALRLSLGIAAAVAFRETFISSRSRGAAVAMLVVAMAVTASLSLVRVFEVAWRSPAPLARLVEVLQTVRISPTIPDFNAMGALMLLGTALAISVVWRPGLRWLGIAALPLLLAANWLAGSRTTLLLSPVVLILFAFTRAGDRSLRRVLGALTLVVAVAFGALALAAGGGRYGLIEGAWSVRRDFAVVTARMLQESPLHGVGIGQYRRRSTEFMPASLRGEYQAENAHNQFLQVIGELGLVGAGGFLGLVALGLAPVRSRETLSSPERSGLALAVGGLLLTWPTQHPLLVFEVAAAFWMVLGLLRATREPERAAVSRAASLGTLAAALVLLAGVPGRITSGVASRDMTEQFRGFSTWHEHADGGYRETASGGTIFLEGDAMLCLVPLRARGVPDVTSATILIDGRSYGTVRVARGVWNTIPLTVPGPPRPSQRNHRLDLVWEPPNRRARLDLGAVRCWKGRRDD